MDTDGCVGTDVDIGPGRALDGVVIAQESPDDVTVEQVMDAQHVSDEESDGDGLADTERYRFELKPLVRERRNRFPFARDWLEGRFGSASSGTARVIRRSS